MQLWDFSLGTQERVRNSRGKRAISVRAATEILLKFIPHIVAQCLSKRVNFLCRSRFCGQLPISQSKSLSKTTDISR